MPIAVVLNIVAVIMLSAYALHEAVLLSIFLRLRVGSRLARSRKLTSPNQDEILPAQVFPTVTVQLPLYNERYVADRVIAAACALDYPRDRLQIQVLDDSTDDTSRIARLAVQNARDHGLDAAVVHRNHRDGYKAGALANGLRTARGEYILILDADFVPGRDLLRRIIQSCAFDDARVAFVQTRWGHANAEANGLTRAQATMLDMHFVIDQVVRSRTGLKMNFNGSGGVWRREAIADAGGWQADTLTEDLDLSYRAQLRGWRGVYLADEVCPGELPVTVLAFKRQQARWARGSAQCLRKLAPRILRSDMPVAHKLAALMHISGYFINLFVLLLALVTPWLLLDTSGLYMLPHWLSAVSVIGLSPILAMLTAQAVQGRTRLFLSGLPLAIVLGIGVALSNSVAVLSGLLSHSSGEFVRTPKSAFPAGVLATPAGRGLQTGDSAVRQSYALQTDWTLQGELALGLYTACTGLVLVLHGVWLSAVPILFYAVGFLGVAAGQIAPGIWQPLRERFQQNKVGSGLPTPE